VNGTFFANGGIGERSAGDGAAGEASVEDEVAGEESAGEESAGEESAGEESAGEESAGEESTGEVEASWASGMFPTLSASGRLLAAAPEQQNRQAEPETRTGS
jgi:hypothetical protein